MAWLASTCSPRRTGQFRGTDDSQRALRRADEDTLSWRGNEKQARMDYAEVEMKVVTLLTQITQTRI